MPSNTMHLARPRRALRRGEAGQALPLVLVALVLAALVAGGLVRLGAVVHDRAAAQAAADASALAGAQDGEDAARRLARVNGAELVGFTDDAPAVEVVVVRRGIRARARAEWRPGPRLQGLR